MSISSRPAVLRPRRLIGRDSEIRDVSESVTSAPVTSVLGPGGVGKTALALAVAGACAGDFPGGVTVVWLGSLRSADLVVDEAQPNGMRRESASNWCPFPVHGASAPRPGETPA